MLYCFAFGGIIGFVYDFINAFLLPLKKGVGKHFINLIWWVVVAFLFVIFNYFFRLGNFRLYKLAVILVGLIFYFNSFHKIIAFFINKVYNKYDKFIKKLKNKRFKNDVTKKEKDAFRPYFRLNNAICNISGNNCVSNNGNRSKIQRNKKIG